MSDGVDAKAENWQGIVDSPGADADMAVQHVPDEMELRERTIADADEVKETSKEQEEK